jgi:hypothetical protein
MKLWMGKYQFTNQSTADNKEIMTSILRKDTFSLPLKMLLEDIQINFVIIYLILFLMHVLKKILNLKLLVKVLLKIHYAWSLVKLQLKLR